MPRVSIITPTKDRQGFLPAIWNCIRAQSEGDFEWLVHDSSAQAAPMFQGIDDARVRYVHEPQQMTIGAKRNALCEAAKGAVIAHLDDDDYYAPHYIERMLSFMDERGADFVKLFGFFLYCRGNDTFAYWDLEYDHPFHYCLRPDAPLKYQVYRSADDAQWGYGFSYVFRRRVWEAIRFPDRNHGEDQEFANAVVKRFKSAGTQDRDHLCVHVMHTGNTSNAYPQRVLRRTQLPELFPEFS